MPDVILRFERENRDGVVAVGSYLIDAARRFGIVFEAECNQVDGIHHCSAVIANGAASLSPLTIAETEHFSSHGRRENERLTCQTKIERPGEIIIMTNEKDAQEKENAPADDSNEQYKKKFSDLPLEKKLSTLVQLEAIALGETFSFIVNSPYAVFDKVMDVMAEFGFKKEDQKKKAARPGEHQSDASGQKSKSRPHGKGTSRTHTPKDKPSA